MDTKRYTNGRREVEAAQINVNNGPDVARWCGGSWTAKPRLPSGEVGSYVLLAGDGDEEENRLMVGHWVLKNADGSFSGRDHDTFENQYDEAPTE